VTRTSPAATGICIARKMTGTAKIDFDAVVCPASSKSSIMWELTFADPAKNKSGTMSTQPGWSQSIDGDCTLRLGFDSNSNGVLTSGEVLQTMDIQLVYLGVSDVDILLSDSTRTPFVASGSDNEFDPFYDDALIGGHSSFDITEEAWAVVDSRDAKHIDYSDALTAAGNLHVADVQFAVTADSKARIAVYQNCTWPASDVLVEPVLETDATAGTNTVSVWSIDQEEEDDYVAYVGAYLGCASSSNSEYCEDAMHPTSEPVSPRGLTTGREHSPDFLIKRERYWGAVHGWMEESNELVPDGLTPAEVSTHETTATVTGVICGAILGWVCPATYPATLYAAICTLNWWAWKNFDYWNGGLYAPGWPVGSLAGDTCVTLVWHVSRYYWDGYNYVPLASGGRTGTYRYCDYRRDDLPGYSMADKYEFTWPDGVTLTYPAIVPSLIKQLAGESPYPFPVTASGDIVFCYEPTP